MDIVLFKDVTTEEFLTGIEEEGKKYEGLYVDMEDQKQRKYVKDKASSIASLLKTLERARIDKSKDYKIQVESEAAEIKERLEGANEPFTLLIDEHKAARAKVLAEEKRVADEKALLLQIEEDHEEALTMNELFEFKKSESIRLQKEHEENLKQEAAERAKIQAEQVAKEAQERVEREKEEAIQREEQAKLAAQQAEEARIASEARAKQDAIDAETRAKIAAENAEVRRLADIEQAKQVQIQAQKDQVKAEQDAQAKLEANKKHAGLILGEIKKHIMESCGIDEPLARKIVLALRNTDRVTINY